MPMRTQIYTPVDIPNLSLCLKLVSDKQSKNNSNSKKIFSRKPINHQNISRLVSFRMKTQEQQHFPQYAEKQIQNYEEIQLDQTKSKRFVSTKSSKSLRRLIVNPENCQLSLQKQIGEKKNQSILISNLQINYNENHHNQCPNLFNSNKCKDGFQNNQKLVYPTDSTKFSSNKNIYNDDLVGEQNTIYNQDHTLSCSFNKNIFSTCSNCLVNQRKFIELQENFRQLTKQIKEKQSEIKTLNLEMSATKRCLKQSQNYLTNLECKIQFSKQKEILLQCQKQEIYSSYRKLQTGFNKLVQEIRYKDLEVNISKIYKTKSLQLEFKVETLKKQLMRAKMNNSKMIQSLSSRDLQIYPLKRNFSEKILKSHQQDCEKKPRQPKLMKVYEEDTIFSLSSEDHD